MGQPQLDVACSGGAVAVRFGAIHRSFATPQVIYADAGRR
jgi:hypothetical protein